MVDRLEYPLILEAYGPKSLKENVEERPGNLGWPRQLFGIDLESYSEDADLEIMIFDAADKNNSMRFWADMGWYNRSNFVEQVRKWRAGDEKLLIVIHRALFCAKPGKDCLTKYKFVIKH